MVFKFISMNLFNIFSVNSLLYAIILFITVYGSLQIQKAPIPFSATITYASMFLLLILKWKKILKSSSNDKYLLRILVFGCLVLLFKTQQDKSYFEPILLFFQVFMIALLLEQASKQDLKLSKILFILFIIANCLLIYYERKTMMVLLWNSEEYGTYRNEIDDLTIFRSSGFTGHPVLGGFLLSIELAFIQMSKMKQSFKYIFTVLLFFALLCVNSRANIGMSGLVSLYLFKDALLNNKHRFIKVLAIFLGFYFFYDLITTTDFGGRLLNTESGTNDESTMARFEAFSFTDYLTWNELLWGDLDLADHLMQVMGLAGIENGYIVLVLKYGLLAGGILIVLLTIYQWKVLSVYPKAQRIILFLLFVLIANTNPHIGHSVPWIFWILSYYLFRPSFVKLKYDNKYNKEDKA